MPITVHDGFREAVMSLCERAGEGDTVLLSPAATAYGEFENYEKRGECFTRIVKEMYP